VRGGDLRFLRTARLMLGFEARNQVRHQDKPETGMLSSKQLVRYLGLCCRINLFKEFLVIFGCHATFSPATTEVLRTVVYEKGIILLANLLTL